MTCPHCEAKDERIAWLESELGLQREASELDRLRAEFKARRGGGNANKCAARVALALYHARGRVVTYEQIAEAVPPASGDVDERIGNNVSVWICFARRALGKDAIQNAWGRGYRLTETGMEKVAAILSQAAPADARAA